MKNLLAVTSNMYLLPGLRLKGLTLSKWEETPVKMEIEGMTTTCRDRWTHRGDVRFP